jgi:phosphopantothenoylcysteine decarboxylase/phosphopantothenate--cysteine ligase
MLKGKKILIGVTGSIAAYKAILLVRCLVKEGAEVKVIMTSAAKEFVSPLVLSTLSKNEVNSELFNEHNWNNHVALGRWADIMIIAPASCNTIAKMANGLCDNLLLATYLSSTCKIVVCPAMDEDMWKHPATISNLEKLQSFGNSIMQVNTGELASGLYGPGRMAEPDEIIQYLKANFFRESILKNKKVLITAGPTYEPLDPVRFIGNHSSGKMGYALAEAFFENGATVHVVSGPSNQKLSYTDISLQKVETASNMYDEVMAIISNYDIIVMAAAVADYEPVIKSDQKIKKSADNFSVELKRTKDILSAIGKIKTSSQILIGFALETQNEEQHAVQKLNNKNADAIVLNSLQDEGAGFGFDTNKVTIFFKDGNKVSIEKSSKKQIAEAIVALTAKMKYEKV